MDTSNTSCPVCAVPSSPLFEVRIFRELPRMLYRCGICNCGFFPNPDWLDRAYSNAISQLDTGLLERAIDISNVLTPFVFFSKYRNSNILDYGGGIGTLARMLRDRGFKAFSSDPMSVSAFSLPEQDGSSSEFVTMVEVVEHLEQPFETISRLSKETSLLFISTLAAPDVGISDNWWYLLPDTGQHIFFPSTTTFEVIAQRIGWHYFGNGSNLHVLSSEKINLVQRLVLKRQGLSWLVGHLMYILMRSRGFSRTDMDVITRQISGH